MRIIDLNETFTVIPLAYSTLNQIQSVRKTSSDAMMGFVFPNTSSVMATMTAEIIVMKLFYVVATNTFIALWIANIEYSISIRPILYLWRAWLMKWSYLYCPQLMFTFDVWQCSTFLAFYIENCYSTITTYNSQSMNYMSHIDICALWITVHSLYSNRGPNVNKLPVWWWISMWLPFECNWKRSLAAAEGQRSTVWNRS